MTYFTAMLSAVADALCGVPLFVLLIGGGLVLFISSGALPLRLLPEALRSLRDRQGGGQGQISSARALAGVVAATVGMGNIAGVALALAAGGPGAIFWMWVSAAVGMASKYHEGVLAIAYRHTSPEGEVHGGPMHIIRRALPRCWHWMAPTFAVAGMAGTLCILNANQLAEAALTVAGADATAPEALPWRVVAGLAMALVVGVVALGGVKRVAKAASVMVPAMVGLYMAMVAAVLVLRADAVPGAVASIFREAFSLEAGWGALIGVAVIGARRAMMVNDAGVGTASIMHSESRNDNPRREGLVAMLGPAIDSGMVCTLTALALLVTVDFGALREAGGAVKGLSLAMEGFGSALPGGRVWLMVATGCFALSSMMSYSFYGARCAAYLMGERGARAYTWVFVASLVLFASVTAQAAVAVCDMLYFFMALPTMTTLLLTRRRVAAITRQWEPEKSEGRVMSSEA